jgi:hypothetical protein
MIGIRGKNHRGFDRPRFFAELGWLEWHRSLSCVVQRLDLQDDKASLTNPWIEVSEFYPLKKGRTESFFQLFNS